MLPDQQQRIMGYFIEEAKDHLNTIEQGLLSLQATIEDSEKANEVFRAAHSVKGGAAMLGLDSIQKTAHRMEDYFKILKESPVQVDRTLETMFLRVSDGLKDLLEELEGPFGLTQDKAQEIMSDVEPIFSQIEEHLGSLVSSGNGSSSFSGASDSHASKSAQESFKRDVPPLLRQMLKSFKQPDTIDTRKTLQNLCKQLKEIGEQFSLTDWCDLVETARLTAANPENDYRTLAPVLIKEIKKAQDLVLTGRASEVAVSDAMQELLPEDILGTDLGGTVFEDKDLIDVADDLTLENLDTGSNEVKPIEASDSLEDLFLDQDSSSAPNSDSPSEQYQKASIANKATTRNLFDSSKDESNSDELGELFEDELFEMPSQNSDLSTKENRTPVETDSEDIGRLSVDLDFDEIPSELSTLNRHVDSNEKADESLDALLATVNVTGPDVGSEELTSLADLFDGDLDELDNTLGGHAFVTEEMRLNPEKIDLTTEVDDLIDLFAEDPSDSEELTSETISENNDLDDDLFGGTLTEGEFAISDAFSEMDSMPLDNTISEAVDSDFGDSLFDEGLIGDTAEKSQDSSATSADAALLTEDIWAEDTQEDLPIRKEEVSDVKLSLTDSLTSDSNSELQSTWDEQEADVVRHLDMEQMPLEDVELGESASDELSLDEDFPLELSVEGEAVELRFAEPAIRAEPADAGSAATANNTSSSVQGPYHSTSPVSHTSASPTETEIEFPTLTGAKLQEAEKAIDSFFLDNQSETRNESGSDLSLDEFDENLSSIDLGDAPDEQIEDAPWGEFVTDELLEESPSEADSANLDDLMPLNEEAVLSESEEAVLPLISSTTNAINSEVSPSEPKALKIPQENFGSDDSTATDMVEDESTVENEPQTTSSAKEESTDDSVQPEALLDGLFDISNEEPSGSESIQLSELASANLDDLSAEDVNHEPKLTEIEKDESEAESIIFDNLDDDLTVDDSTDDDLLEVDFLNDSFALEHLESGTSEIDETFLGLDELLEEESVAETAELTEANKSNPTPVSEEQNALSGNKTGSDVKELGVSGLEDALGDDFDDLESLLEEVADEQAGSSSNDIAAKASISAEDDDEGFGDLERLLEDDGTAKGGPSPSVTRRSPQRTSRRNSNSVREQNMRVSVKHLDTLSNLVGELVVSRNILERDQERLRQFLDNLLFQVQQLNDVGQRMRDLYERSLLESSLMSNRRARATGGEKNNLASVDHATGEIFDALEMDKFTGFHTLSQEMIELIVRVRESSSDIGYTVESSDQVTRQFRQITTQLQEGLNTARMVAFSQAADRLPRAVRDISLKCGKEARLIVEGQDTLIDKMIVEHLYDPLTHLVNNAITHGIETPDKRRASGKVSEGSITVRAFYQGNQTVIYVADDGGGINTEFVKRKAIEKKLITQAEASDLSDIETYDLLFHPGFSTRDQADDFAGRGVGMDVVRTSLAEIRGSITIDSEMGKGTSFTIRLPLTLSISKALSCVSNQARIAFPMDGVEDMLDVPRSRILKNDNDQDCVRWRDTLLPFQPVTELLKFNRTIGRGRVYGGAQDDDVLSVIVLRSANTFVAIQVDQVIGEQEIVIKQLEGPVPKPLGIAGATVLGDGRVMPIADVLELIDIAMGRVRREPTSMLWAEAAEAIEETPVKSDPTVLIVDDSITVRELLSMSFNKVGYRVEQARDGQEAWDKLRSGLPCDLVFCDIEMPRMDGLELLSRMQKDNHLNRIPIAMLTSRGADRHRQMAVDLGASGYFTKPYLEEALLDAAQRMLNGETLAKGRGG